MPESAHVPLAADSTFRLLQALGGSSKGCSLCLLRGELDWVPNSQLGPLTTMGIWGINQYTSTLSHCYWNKTKQMPLKTIKTIVQLLPSNKTYEMRKCGLQTHKMVFATGVTWTRSTPLLGSSCSKWQQDWENSQAAIGVFGAQQPSLHSGRTCCFPRKDGLGISLTWAQLLDLGQIQLQRLIDPGQHVMST